MVKVTLKDGSVKEVESGKLIIELARDLSQSLAKKCVVARVDGALVDLKSPITKDCSLELITNDLPEAFEVLNHSCAHLLAQAVKRLYPGTQCGVGPAIEEGFYYDLAIPQAINAEDLPKIEAEMKNISQLKQIIDDYLKGKEQTIKIVMLSDLAKELGYILDKYKVTEVTENEEK